MVAARRQARSSPSLVAEGLIELAGIERPSSKAIGAASVLADFLVGASHFFFPKG